MSQDHPKNSERRKQKKGKEISNEEKREENPETFELDPRDKTGREKEEPTELLVLEETQPDKTVKIGAGLSEQVKRNISNLLKEYKGIFAWSHEDIVGGRIKGGRIVGFPASNKRWKNSWFFAGGECGRDVAADSCGEESPQILHFS